MKKKAYSLILFFFITHCIFAQSEQNVNPNIASIEKYFELDRENIQLSVNKNTFTTNESIWFKGTVISKKSQLIFPFTTNVLVNLVNSEGKIIDNQLVYCENGVFSGSFQLDKKTPSGDYYLQVYTNFMNNFSENESTVYKIKIYNPTEENFTTATTVDLNSIETRFYPESGIFLHEITNTFAVQIADCNGNIPTVTNAKIVNQAGEEVTNFSFNADGIGRFEIFDTKYETYKLIFESHGKIFEKQLPLCTLKGLVFSTNNYSFEGKTFVTLKTNKATLAEFKNKGISMYILGNAKVNLVNIKSLNALETKFMVPNSEFFKGANTLFLTNGDNQKLAERSLFFTAETKSIVLKVLDKSNGKITMQGNSNLKKANLSVSILPSTSLSFDNNQTAINQLLFANNFDSGLKNPAYYFKEITAKVKYELDTELLTKKSKYTWEAINGNAPIKKFDFDYGLEIKGTANADMKNSEPSKVRMSAVFLGIDQKVNLNNKNEFIFPNLFVQDSTKLYFELFNGKGQKETLRTSTQVTNASRKFIKVLNFEKTICNTTNFKTEKIQFPTTATVIDLNTIEIQNKKKANELTRDIPMAKGFKITEEMCNQYFDIFSFLTANGYNVTRAMGEVQITPIGGNLGIGGGGGAPAVFVNNILEFDLSFLDTYSFCDIDEIFINRRGGGGGPDSINGVIYIFTKKMSDRKQLPEAYQSQAFIIKNGFKKAMPYVSPNYFSTSEKAFQQYGAIHWISDVFTDNDGNFQFKIPSMGQKEVSVIIEGVDSEGSVVSIVKNLKL